MTNAKQRLFLVFMSALILAAVFSDGRIDLWFSDLWFDRTAMLFPVAELSFVDHVLYRGHKIFMVDVALFLVGWGVRLLQQGQQGFSWVHMWVGIGGTVAIVATVALLKKQTGIECPWSLERYGGVLPYVSLEEAVRLALGGQFGQGRCFPAGHATGGLFLLAWATAFSEVFPKLANIIYVIAVALGFLMGLLRVAQGAHFLSHVVWAIWTALVITYFLQWCLSLRSK